MNENDYDEDGNCIVDCPLCLTTNCPSVNDGGECPIEKRMREDPKYAEEFMRTEEKSVEEINIPHFRAWVYCDWDHLENGKWQGVWTMVEVLTIHIAKKNFRGRYIDSNGEKNVHNYCINDTNILMQYIGIDDVNGERIYTGDLFKCIYCDDDLFEIYKDETGYSRRLVNSKEESGCGNTHCVHMSDFKRYAKVGNVHDNPELIRQQ